MDTKLHNYKILTKTSVLECKDKRVEFLVERNNAILKKGFDFSKFYSIHFFECWYTNDCVTDLDISSAIQCLAIKEGYDFVQYQNGRYGFVGYYNGNMNGFEILNESEEL